MVDDASRPEYAHRCAACDATLPSHGRNLGKSAALKTGMTHAATESPGCGMVTADADRQHHLEDISSVAGRLERASGTLVLGVRQFRVGALARSRAGNRMAQLLVPASISGRFTHTESILRLVNFIVQRVRIFTRKRKLENA